MAEWKTKNLIIEVGDAKYKMVGSKLEDICAELGISEERFVELLARDFYCPTLTAAPTSSTLTYTDSDGSANHFQVGQPCRWLEGNDYRLAVCKNITSSASSWYVFPGSLSELMDDNTHRLVTDTEKNTWNGKISGDGNITNIAVVSALPSSPNAKTMYIILAS